MTAPRRADLAAALRQARRDGAGLSGNAFAARLGWQQSKVWRIESGDQLPSVSDIDAWAAAAGADLAELHELRRRAAVRDLNVREAAQRAGGVATAQAELEELERTAAVVAEYQPMLIPGLAQTADYTREWLSQPGRPTLVPDLNVVAAVEARARRQTMLGETGRAVTVAVNEAALWAVYGTVAIQRAQLDHLARIATDGLVELLVEPRTGTLATMRGFELLDDVVSLEDIEGLRILGDPDVVAGYRRALDGVRERAYGPDSTEVVRRVRAAL